MHMIWLLRLHVKNLTKYILRSYSQNGYTKFQLEPDLYWIWDDTGFSHLIHINSLTGKWSYVISDGGAPAETEVIFEVEVDDRGAAIVLKDTNLDLLDAARYQLNIEYEW